jgi:hypothetical protein
MSGLARIGPAAALLLAACAVTPPVEPAGAPPRPPVMPASALPRMTSEVEAVDPDDFVNEVTDPDGLRSVLADAGFAAAMQRSFGGGTGAFSRVLARGLAFDDDQGAAAFVAWFGEHAPQEFITSERISPAGVPAEVAVFHHEPDGCCHNDVPAFLAAWQRGSSVLFLHAGGRRANVRAFVGLIESFDRVA